MLAELLPDSMMKSVTDSRYCQPSLVTPSTYYKRLQLLIQIADFSHSHQLFPSMSSLV